MKKHPGKRKPTFDRDGYIIHVGYRIRRKERKGGYSYAVDLGRAGGRHIRKQFKTVESAKIWAEDKRTELTQEGLSARTLDDKARQDAAEALHILEKSGVSLTEAAEFYISRNRPPELSISLADLRQRYLADCEQGMHRPKGKKKKKLDPLTLRDIAGISNRLIDLFGSDTPAHAFETSDLDTWIEDQNVGPVTQAKYKRYLQGFFQYGITKGYLSHNPAIQIDVEAAETELPSFL
ncbi:MAG: hypothetical protein AAF492_27600, partial [Verrucomicrobiota bacterium]